jgi:hypothetical protein
MLRGWGVKEVKEYEEEMIDIKLEETTQKKLVE